MHFSSKENSCAYNLSNISNLTQKNRPLHLLALHMTLLPHKSIHWFMTCLLRNWNQFSRSFNHNYWRKSLHARLSWLGDLSRLFPLHARNCNLFLTREIISQASLCHGTSMWTAGGKPIIFAIFVIVYDKMVSVTLKFQLICI